MKIEKMDISSKADPFAGRIGGNLRYAVDPNDPDYASIHNSIPDGVPGAPWSALLSPRGFLDSSTWKKAFCEGIGVCLQVYFAGLMGAGLAPLTRATSLGAVLPVALAAVAQFLSVSFMILNLGPISGGHLNPLISFACLLTRLSSLPRTVLYVVFQCLGSVAGAFLVRGSLGVSAQDFRLSPGCYIDPHLVSPSEAFALEVMSSMFLLFHAFGLGLDPRNANAFPQALGPFLIGGASALTLFMGGIARKGYLGASNNPARCFGMMAAGGRFTYHHVHWLGNMTAALINAFLYFIVPPYKMHQL